MTLEIIRFPTALRACQLFLYKRLLGRLAQNSHSSKMIYPTNFGNSFTFPPMPPVGSHFWLLVKYFHNYQLDCYEICYKRSWPQEDESYNFGLTTVDLLKSNILLHDQFQYLTLFLRIKCMFLFVIELLTGSLESIFFSSFPFRSSVEVQQ